MRENEREGHRGEGAGGREGGVGWLERVKGEGGERLEGGGGR